MNEVFIIVKILECRYGFLLNNKNSAICKIIGKLENKSIIKLIAYDEIADKCFRRLKISNKYVIQGKLNSNIKIIIKEIYKI